MQCKNCGKQVPDTAKVCGYCGASTALFCPNCGTANLAGAKFCISCGNKIEGLAASRTLSPARTGLSGWAWVIFGILLGFIVIGGLVVGGVLPLRFASEDPLPAPLEPVFASPEVSTEVSTEAGYCPEAGGVILYWNAGFDCTNDTDDPGYRQRVGDGFQDLNTGGFDNQASAIKIPLGWSVHLFANPGLKGPNLCLNASLSNFEEHGRFPSSNLLINDNVSSMQVFRDGTCGQDLAAGAEPAPWSKEEIDAIAPKGVDCTDQDPCGCLPEELKMFMPVEGHSSAFADEFRERFVNEVTPHDDGVYVTFKPEFAQLYEAMKAVNLQVRIGLDWIENGEIKGGAFEEDCWHDAAMDDFVCSAEVAEGLEFIPDAWGVHINYESPAVFAWCAAVNYQEDLRLDLQNLTEPDTQPQDCRNYGCPSGQTCNWVGYSSSYQCVKEKSNDSSNCTPGCWCEISGQWGCWQSCAPHCSD